MTRLPRSPRPACSSRSTDVTPEMEAAHTAGAEALEEPLTSDSLPLPATGVLYHYTTRAAAQEMSIAGQLLSGFDGYIYLTDVLYTIGWQATDRLALPDKNAEAVIA